MIMVIYQPFYYKGGNMYEFIKIDSDTYKLKYKEKEFEFKKDIKLMSEFQSLNANARNRLIIDLSKEGMTIEDLKVKKEENGKTYYDNTNVVEMEKNYIKSESLKMFDKITDRYFKMSLLELLNDIGIFDEKETEIFSTKLIKILTGKDNAFPSDRG